MERAVVQPLFDVFSCVQFTHDRNTGTEAHEFAGCCELAHFDMGLRLDLIRLKATCELLVEHTVLTRVDEFFMSKITRPYFL